MKKCKCIKHFMLILSLQRTVLLKTRLQHGCIFKNFEKLFNLQPATLLKTTPAQLFSYEFAKVHLREAAAYDLSLLDSFVRIIVY